MKVAVIVGAILVGVALVVLVIRIADDTLAPLFLNSRIERLGEKNLPKIQLEKGCTIYCRMSACDFRFPLPKGARIARADTVSGGFDTIKGAVYVTNEDGTAVDLQAYSGLLRKQNFKVQPGFSSEADPPWAGTPAKRNHPEGYTIPFAASTADGGWVAVDVIDHTIKVAFSYFGDR
jgi:hypothetical protein